MKSQLEWEELETLEGIKSATIKLNGKEIKVAAHTSVTQEKFVNLLKTVEKWQTTTS